MVDIPITILSTLLAITILSLVAFITYHAIRVDSLEADAKKKALKQPSLAPSPAPSNSSSDMYIGLAVRPQSDGVRDVTKGLQGVALGVQGYACDAFKKEMDRELGGRTFRQYVDEEMSIPQVVDAMGQVSCEEFKKNMKDALVKAKSEAGVEGADQILKGMEGVVDAVLRHSCNDKGTVDARKAGDLIVSAYDSVCYPLTT